MKYSIKMIAMTLAVSVVCGIGLHVGTTLARMAIKPVQTQTVNVYQCFDTEGQPMSCG